MSKIFHESMDKSSLIAIKATENDINEAKAAFEKLKADGFNKVCIVLATEDSVDGPIAKAAFDRADAIYEL